MMLFDASAKDALPESTQTQCESLRMLFMSVVQIQMSSFKTSSLGIQHKLSQMRQKVLENRHRHSSCYKILNRLIGFCVLLAGASQGLGGLPCFVHRPDTRAGNQDTETSWWDSQDNSAFDRPVTTRHHLSCIVL